MIVDGQHLEFTCAVCGAPACFGFGCNLLKVPPKLGIWWCREHRPREVNPAALTPAPEPRPAAAPVPAPQGTPEAPGPWRLL